MKTRNRMGLWGCLSKKSPIDGPRLGKTSCSPLGWLMEVHQRNELRPGVLDNSHEVRCEAETAVW